MTQALVGQLCFIFLHLGDTQVSPGDAWHRDNTHTHTPTLIHTKGEVWNRWASCVCVSVCQQGCGLDQRLNLVENHLSVKVGQFFSNCQRRDYSIFNFDALSDLIALWEHHAHTLYCSLFDQIEQVKVEARRAARPLVNAFQSLIILLTTSEDLNQL